MYFKDIEDPRKGWNVQYPLEEVMLVAMVSFLVERDTKGVSPRILTKLACMEEPEWVDSVEKWLGRYG